VERGKQARKRILTTLLLFAEGGGKRILGKKKKDAAASVKSGFHITGISSKSAGIPSPLSRCHSILITVCRTSITRNCPSGELLHRNLVPAFRLNKVPLGGREADGAILVLVKDYRIIRGLLIGYCVD